jgi:hypothetical protein
MMMPPSPVLPLLEDPLEPVVPPLVVPPVVPCDAVELVVVPLPLPLPLPPDDEEEDEDDEPPPLPVGVATVVPEGHPARRIGASHSHELRMREFYSSDARVETRVAHGSLFVIAAGLSLGTLEGCRRLHEA